MYTAPKAATSWARLEGAWVGAGRRRLAMGLLAVTARRRQGQGGGFFERAEDDGSAGGADGRDGAEALAQEAAQRGGVRGAHLDEVAVLAGDVMHLLHLGDAREQGAGLRRAERLVRADEDEGQQAEVHRVGVNARLVAAQDAARFELADALEDGGG